MLGTEGSDLKDERSVDSLALLLLLSPPELDDEDFDVWAAMDLSDDDGGTPLGSLSGLDGLEEEYRL